MITFVKDKDLIWETEKYDVILVATTIFCALGNGFQNKLRNKYPLIEEINNKTPYGDLRKLGKRTTIDGQPIISLMYCYGHGNKKKDYLNYDAFEKCLLTANAEFKGKKIACTLLGCSQFDGNGDKEKCLSIIEKCCRDLDITIYDYEQLSRHDEIKRQYLYIDSFKYKDKEKYDYLRNNRIELLKKLYLVNG